MAAILFWITIAVIAASAGFAIAGIRNVGLRRALYLVAAVIPIGAIMGTGLLNGCALRTGGQECFGFGFGLVFSVIVTPAWIVLMCAGSSRRRRVKN